MLAPEIWSPESIYGTAINYRITARAGKYRLILQLGGHGGQQVDAPVLGKRINLAAAVLGK